MILKRDMEYILLSSSASLGIHTYRVSYQVFMAWSVRNILPFALALTHCIFCDFTILLNLQKIIVKMSLLQVVKPTVYP